MPDTGRAELLDGNWPSGSGKEIQEMPPHSPAELMTSRHSPRSIAQNPKSLNRLPWVSKKRTKGNWTRSGESEGFSHIELPILSSLRRPLSRRKSSHHTSRNPERPSTYPLRCQPLDLNRSLPTTPISESPQMSPFATSLSSQFTIRDYYYTHSNRTSVASLSGSIERLPKGLTAQPGKAHGRHKHSHPGDSSLELDTLISTGVSGSQTL